MTTAPPLRRRSSMKASPGSAPRPEQGYEPGDVIGERFRLIRAERQGGMGTVWVAHNLVLDVHVAIKLIDLKDNPEADGMAQRLLEEARAAAKLRHAAIVRVHDFGLTSRRDPFLAMELLDGEDLANLLERDEKLEPASAVQVLLPIAHGLWVAHEKGIVHRDVKPENIFLAKDKEVAIQPKLLDFGIARIIDKPRNLTVEGAVVGTPDYMSPEQARGEPPGPSADIWSFCVVLYELMTGRCPFIGPNYNALMRAIIERPPMPLAAHGVSDDRLWWILERGLKKQPAERWASMKELGGELANWLIAQGITEDITGTSLERSWFREPENGDWVDISQLTRMPSDPRIYAGSDLTCPGSRPVAAPHAVTDSGQRSGPDLGALAELGDPVEAMQRVERRRLFAVVVVLMIALAAAAVGMLAGTGILAF